MSMTVKEYLSGYINTERRIKAKQRRIFELRDLAKYMGMSYSEKAVKVQSSKRRSKTEEIITAYMDMENEIISDINELKLKLNEIMCVIKSLDDDTEKEVLERRYINGDGYSMIAEMMCFSQRQIYRIHGKALEHLKPVIERHIELC